MKQVNMNHHQLQPPSTGTSQPAIVQYSCTLILNRHVSAIAVQPPSTDASLHTSSLSCTSSPEPSGKKRMQAPTHGGIQHHTHTHIHILTGMNNLLLVQKWACLWVQMQHTVCYDQTTVRSACHMGRNKCRYLSHH